MESLARINSLLDAREQRFFNRFIDGLAVNPKAERSEERMAWTPSSFSTKQEILLAAQRSGRFTGLA